MAWGLTALSPPDRSLALTTVLKSLHPELGRSRAVRAKWERRAGTGAREDFQAQQPRGPLLQGPHVSEAGTAPQS